MNSLDRIDPEMLTQVLAGVEADGWLLYDFRGVNPVVQRVVVYDGMVTRRVFVWLPAQSSPIAIVHSIDAGAIAGFPGEIVTYTTWQELHRQLELVVAGKRVAMEVSLKNEVPYLDRVPQGVVELLREFGTEVVPSDQLVTKFAATWTDTELDAHRAAGESVAKVARSILASAVCEADRINELDIQKLTLEQFAHAGLIVEDPPIVAFGANAANPHHNTAQSGNRILRHNEVVLLDLWAMGGGSAWADQTWMGFSGDQVPADVLDVWDAVRDARDAVVEKLWVVWSVGDMVTGAMLDRAARNLLESRGYGADFVHRTGHSIDNDLHGSGPHLDDFETHDVRCLVPGIVFSVEPGVYLSGRFGVRSEINIIMGEQCSEVTPQEPQTQLILPK